MKKNDVVYLEHILESIERIQQYMLESKSYRDFCEDMKTQDAVIRHFEIIGEAAKSLSEKVYLFLKEKNIPLKAATDMRNILVHQYFDIDLEVVWYTYKKDLPVLKKALQDYLKTQ